MANLTAKLDYTGKLDFLLSKEYIIDKNVTTIGRSKDSDIILHPTNNVYFSVDLGGKPMQLPILGNHARIIKEGDNFYIEDLGSLVGTSVNGRKLGSGPLKQTYRKFYDGTESCAEKIREKNKGIIKLKNKDKITLGEGIFKDKNLYSFIFRVK